MSTLQQQLDNKYPIEELKKAVREIYIHDFNEEWENPRGGKLDLSTYPNLETIHIPGKHAKSPLTELILGEQPNLKSLYLDFNQLTNLDFLNQLTNPQKLLKLNVTDNNIESTNIEIFSKFVNLEVLEIGTLEQAFKKRGRHNDFFGSLESLKHCTSLKNLFISNTNIDSGLEYLTTSFVQELKKVNFLSWRKMSFGCNSTNDLFKCGELYKQMESVKFNLQSWKEKNPFLVKRAEKIIELKPIVDNLSIALTGNVIFDSKKIETLLRVVLFELQERLIELKKLSHLSQQAQIEVSQKYKFGVS